MHSKLASLVRNDIWTCQIVKFALDFAIYKRFHSSQLKSPVGVAGSVLIYIIFHNRVQKRRLKWRWTKSFILGSDYQGGRQMSSCSKFIKDEYHLVILFLERVRLLISLLPRRLVVTAFSPSATPATLLVLLWCSWRSVVLWARYIGDHFMTMTIQKPVQSKWRLAEKNDEFTT